MPSAIPLDELSSHDATLLLRELSLGGAVPAALAPSAIADSLLRAGLAYYEEDLLVAVDPERRSRLIRALVDAWLPDCLPATP